MYKCIGIRKKDKYQFGFQYINNYITAKTVIMCRELQEFSLMIDEQFELAEKTTPTLWSFILNLFK